MSEQENADVVWRESEERYRTIFAAAPIGIALSDRDGYIIVANAAYQRMLGYSHRELRALQFSQITHPDDIQVDLDLFREGMAGELSGYEVVKRYIRKDGEIIWVKVTVTMLRDDQGTPTYDLAMVEDITERKRAEDALQESESRHRQMFEANQAIKLVIDPESGCIVDANPAACRFYGYAHEDLLAMRITQINVLPPAQVQAQLARARDAQQTAFSFQHRLASGEVRDVELHSSPMQLRGHTFLYSIIHDVTDRKRAERALMHQALHDALTDMPNRALLLDRLDRAVRQAKRSGGCVALLLMDLDRFKEVNDTFGHEYGDQLLRQVGVRLQSALRDADSVARLGGDEFAVLLPNTDERGALVAADKLRHALAEPFVVDDQSLDIDASIGIALAPQHGRDASNLLRRADVAMYAAKHARAGVAVYRPDKDEYSVERLTLIRDLRHAIDAEQLTLHYQPKIKLSTGCVDGVEALVRWEHPTRGMIPPDRFIPLAEHAGLIHGVSAFVLNRALGQTRKWHDEGLDAPVAVNLSARNLHDPVLVPTIASLLQNWNADPRWLAVELTESTVMDDPTHAVETLTHLHQMGVSVSIDDFGTGYSSLAYLGKLPVDEIKIDKSFVDGIMTDDASRSIMRATINLGHDLDLLSVAEGVEGRDQRDLLASLECDLVQGYYVSRPLPADECTAWLRRHSVDTSRGPARHAARSR